MLKKTLVFSIVFLIILSTSVFADFYINSNCVNNGDGSSWSCAATNGGSGAFNDMPADDSCHFAGYAWQRGQTYWLAGSDTPYSASCFRITSGNGRITLKKASTSEHGTNTGWQSSYGTKQAVLRRTVLQAQDVTIDGSYRSSPTSGYGIKFEDSGNVNLVHTANNVATANLIFRFLEMTHSSIGSSHAHAFNIYGNGGNLWQNLYIHDLTGLCFKSNKDVSQTGAGFTNSIIEDSICGNIGLTTGTGHTELLKDDGQAEGMVIRNNLFYDWRSTGGLVLSGDERDWKIYNNVFTQRTPGITCGNGVITGLGVGTGYENIKVYNNIFANIATSCADIFILGDFSGPGNEVRNNLFYNVDDVRNVCPACATKSNNWYANTPFYTPTASEIDGGSENPFIDDNNEDFRLKSGASPINAGVDLSSHFTTDKDGVTRPQGLGWDIGAYESQGGSTQTDYYVRQGASGSNDGSDWNNAFTSLPSTLQRGATYYIADGSYPGYTFDDAGTEVITIKKATTSDHGTSTGWSNNYGDGQATFTSDFFMNRDYYVIDGVKRNENDWQESQSYGFRLLGSVTANTANGAEADHITFRYVDVGGPTGQICTASTPSSGFYVVHNGQNNWIISRSHIHNVEIPIITSGSDNMLVEYNHIGPSWQKEAISDQNSDNWVIRHNKFIDNLIFPPPACQRGGDGGTADIWTRTSAGQSLNNWEIYGNVFGDSGSYNNIVRNDAIIQGACIGDSSNNWKVYNNVFYNIMGNQADVNICGGSNNLVHNNLWYKMRESSTPGTAAHIGASASTVSHSWCFEDTSLTIASGCSNLPGSVVLGNEDPFVNVAGLDFRLKPSFSGPSPINTGTTLGSGFDNIDAFGNTRGTHGNWDIGAYEFTGQLQPPPPNPPTPNPPPPNPPPPNPPPSQSGLVGYWNLDDASGNTATDSSTNSNTGTLNGPTWTTGQIDGALNFDGSGDRVQINAANSINDLGPMTVSLWAYANDWGQNGQGFFASKGDTNSGDKGWEFQQFNFAGGSVQFQANFQPTSLTVLVQNIAELNKWIHWTITWDGSNQVSGVNIYKNGQLLTPHVGYSNDGSGSYNSDASKNLIIGNFDVASFGRSWDGVIDEVRIYDRVLSANEVTQVYQFTGTPQTLEGDVNNDGVVNILDLLFVVAEIGRQTFNPIADVNSDGSVNILDLVWIVNRMN